MSFIRCTSQDLMVGDLIIVGGRDGRVYEICVSRTETGWTFWCVSDKYTFFVPWGAPDSWVDVWICR